MALRTKIDIAAKVRLTGNCAEPEFLDSVMNLEYTTDNYLSYSAYQKSQEYQSRTSGSMILELRDGTDIRVYHVGDYASVFGVVKLTGHIKEMMAQTILYSGGGVPLNTLTNGFITATDYYNETISFENHVLWDMYIDPQEGRALYMASYLFFNRRIRMHDGPVSCLQRQGNTVYFLYNRGQMIALSNKFEGYEADLVDYIAENGNEALEEYIEKVIVRQGPFDDFKIVGGVFYTLSTDGTLCSEDQVLAENVYAFEVDNDAVNYIDSRGLWRLPFGRAPKLLVEGEIIDFAPGGCDLFYCKKDGIYAINTRGENPRKVSDTLAEQIICTIDQWKTMLAVLESNTGALKLQYINGSTFTVIDRGVTDFGMDETVLLAATETEMYRVLLTTYDEYNRDPKGFETSGYFPTIWTKSELLNKLGNER